MSRVPETLEPFEERIAKTFPGLVPGSIYRLARFGYANKRSNIFGELQRWRNLQRHLDEEAGELAALKLPAAKRRRLMQRALHSFYLDMYGGDEGDFKRDYRTWRDAVRDVEEMFDMLHGYLPTTLKVGGCTLNVNECLHRPDEVRAEYDPIRLLTFARSGGFGGMARTRHCARVKLYLAQLFYDYRQQGFAPEDIATETAAVKRKIIDRLFARGSYKRVRVVADLDPSNAYACVGYKMSEDLNRGIEEREDQSVMEFDRYLIRGGKRDIEVFFSIRGKEFVPLKSIVKNIRQPELASIGDRVAIRFVFKDAADLEDAVERIRDVIASRPGCVSDQDSTLDSSEDCLDSENAHSSPSFRAMKYNLRYIGGVNETQFATMKGHVDSKCKHDEGNHGDYKIRQYCGSILPISFPTRLTGIPWPSFGKEGKRVVVLTHPDIYEQLANHVRRNLSGRTTLPR